MGGENSVVRLDDSRRNTGRGVDAELELRLLVDIWMGCREYLSR
jgi:hypothetical protein